MWILSIWALVAKRGGYAVSHFVQLWCEQVPHSHINNDYYQEFQGT